MKWIFCTLLLFTLSHPRAFAALGDRVEAVSSDEKALSAKRMNADVFKKYSTQDLESDSTKIKEYIDNNGVVFAVTWNGLDHPDLSVVLGSYFKSYQAEEKKHARKHGERHQKVSAETVVVQKWGKMRNFKGRAYDPSLIPAGVTLDEIK